MPLFQKLYQCGRGGRRKAEGRTQKAEGESRRGKAKGESRMQKAEAKPAHTYVADEEQYTLE